MNFGSANQPRETPAMIERARVAEDRDFDLFGLTDSQSLLRELYATMGAVATAVDSIELGPSVTNPVTRHPAVTASALSTVDEFTNGNAVLGLGGGDSAVRTLGEEPAGLTAMADFMETFGALVGGDTVEYEGHPVNLEWQETAKRDVDVPVLLAAGGPQTLRAGGALADRVLLSWGVNRPEIDAAIEHVEAGARRADRDPSDVEIWIHSWGWFADPANLAEDQLDGLVKSELAAAAHLNFQFGIDGKQVPEAYRDRVADLVERYDSHHHMSFGEHEEEPDEPEPNRRLVEELDLADFLIDRFAINGTADEIVDQLRAVDDLIDGVLFNPVGDKAPLPEAHMLEFTRRMGSDVIPEFR